MKRLSSPSRVARIVWLVILSAVLALSLIAYQAVSTIRSVPALFQRNAQLKAQGYYVGEFEFKMLASQQYLNDGQYLRAFSTLRRIRDEMQPPVALPQMPPHASAEQQMAFLLAQQDPATGAFMDRHYPLFSYIAPTCNVVEALRQLAATTGRPLKLKYPLTFLGRIDTPATLVPYLDSLLYLNETSARLPGPGPYGPGVSELACVQELEDAGLYRFSEAWKSTLLRWLNSTQDPATGYWGARIGSPAHWRQNPDINSTFHIIKLMLDEQGNNLRPDFPLRHGDALANSILQSMSGPMPDEADEQHAWGLNQSQGAKILTRYLWPHLTPAVQDKIRRQLLLTQLQFDRLYRPADGGFAYYAADAKADLDGTGLVLMAFKTMGRLPGTLERSRLWGEPAARALTPRIHSVAQWGRVALPSAAGTDLQFLRVYRDRLPASADWAEQVPARIVYPADATGRDLLEVRQGLIRYLRADQSRFGNWTSVDHLREFPLALTRKLPIVAIERGRLDLAAAAGGNPPVRQLYVVAYDIAQRPLSVDLYRR
ncbi:hypothetical protein [Paludibacterium purpuratum]|uniref:Uncharacterized protein n=1 Tax=Paludibacterium purpuratum TaxID=1144873 RepID=A0A4R7BBQ1_9NEIS|nr:hypothetical protein [Paludibacterium purpuratum]TDR81522.1 hypothetical protein DFP86_103175 [Paludibacterium purpuratum]